MEMRFALDSDTGVAGFPGDPILSTQRNLKEFRVSEISFYLHKEFRAAEIGFSLHKELYEIFRGRPCRKWLFSKGKIGQRWADFRIFNEGRKSSRGDLAENGCFLQVTFANVCGFSDCLMKDGSIHIFEIFQWKRC